MSRIIPYDRRSATHLLEMVGFFRTCGLPGVKANYNLAATTTSSLHIFSQFVELIRPDELFIRTFRWDIADWPEDVNQDHHRLWRTDSGWLLEDLHFRGPEHHVTAIPTSLESLPFISFKIVDE